MKINLRSLLLTILLSSWPVHCQRGYQCCPPGFEGLRPFADCTQFYGCFNGVVTSAPAPCGFGLLFDESKQRCDFPDAVTDCNVDLCLPSAAPSFAPTTSEPTLSPSSEPTRTPQPTPAPSAAPSPAPSSPPTRTFQPSSTPTQQPTPAPKMCCPDDGAATTLRAFNNCLEYYNCVNGIVIGSALPCGDGLKFDEPRQACNFANQVTDCQVDVCMPTAAPSTSPPTTPMPTTPMPTTVMPTAVETTTTTTYCRSHEDDDTTTTNASATNYE